MPAKWDFVNDWHELAKVHWWKCPKGLGTYKEIFFNDRESNDREFPNCQEDVGTQVWWQLPSGEPIDHGGYRSQFLESMEFSDMYEWPCEQEHQICIRYLGEFTFHDGPFDNGCKYIQKCLHTRMPRAHFHYNWPFIESQFPTIYLHGQNRTAKIDEVVWSFTDLDKKGQFIPHNPEDEEIGPWMDEPSSRGSTPVNSPFNSPFNSPRDSPSFPLPHLLPPRDPQVGNIKGEPIGSLDANSNSIEYPCYFIPGLLALATFMFVLIISMKFCSFQKPASELQGHLMHG